MSRERSGERAGADGASRSSGESGETEADGQERPEELAAQLEVLREENRRLRRDHRRLRRTRYRRTGAGLGALGLVALAGAALFPTSRSVLLALASVGLFSAVLVYYLTPERFVAAGVGEATVDAHAATVEALVADLGLRDERVYVPADGGVRLFVPQHADYAVPSAADLEGAVVATDDERRRGVAVAPTGAGLHREFERTLPGEPAEDPALLGEQVADALVEAFELAGAATADAGDGRLTVRVSEPAFGSLDAFDHPVASFVGVAVASALEQPVAIEVRAAADDRVDALVTARWVDLPST